MVKVLTLAIGEDFRKSLVKALDSKRDYCKKQGYTCIIGDEQFWDRERPIPWSKIPFLLDVLKNSEENELVFMSDADVYITNSALRIEDHIVPLMTSTSTNLLFPTHPLNSANILKPAHN